jgi:hypothetical protein
MTDMPNDQNALARVALVRDHELAGEESSVAARALLAAIVASPRQPTGLPALSTRPAPTRRGRPGTGRLVLGSVAATVVTAVLVLLPGLLGDRPGGARSYANAAIDVRLDGRFYVARIKDPLANRERYAEAFRAVGKDVAIALVPVSAQHVGRVLSSGASPNRRAEVITEFESTGAERVDCYHRPARCTLTIKISADTTATVTYTIGRAAQPGEAVVDPKRLDVAPQPGRPSVSESDRTGGGN